MSPFTLVRYALRLGNWITPHIQRFVRDFTQNAREADRHFELRNYREAAQYYAASLKDADARRYPARKKLQILLRLSESLRRCGDLDSAFHNAKEAFDKAKQFGPKDLFYGAAAETLSMVHEDRGELGLALSLARQALDAATGPRMSAVASERAGRLAQLERAAGNIEASKKLLKESINHGVSAHGENHHGNATQLASMAMMLQDEGELAQALPLFEQAYEVHKQSLGATARETLIDLEHIGQIHYLQHNLDVALTSYARLARLKENEIGANPGDHARFLIDAATVHEAAGENGKALEFLMQANQKAGRDAELAPIVTERLDRLRHSI